MAANVSSERVICCRSLVNFAGEVSDGVAVRTRRSPYVKFALHGAAVLV